MALPNLHFYWKYGDTVVPFRIEPIKRPKLAHAFVPRQSRSAPRPELPQQLPAAEPTQPKENRHDGEHADEIEIATDKADDLDTRF